MPGQFDPVLINLFDKHFLCMNIGIGVVRIYEIDSRTERLKFIDDWNRFDLFTSYDEYRAYCFSAVSTNPSPA